MSAAQYPIYHVHKPIFARIMTRASLLTSVPVSVIKGSNRSRIACHARLVVMHILRNEGWSLSQIGRALGGRCHTTIMHGVNRADNLRRTDPRFASLCDVVAA
jgi:chromosomal replication initiator protein